jgi:hypothetical protein
VWPLGLDLFATNWAPQQIAPSAEANKLRDAVNKMQLGERNRIFNVKNYGAAGDGTTDDTAAINNAINAATVLGGTVFFPPGSYRLATAATLNPPGDAATVILKSNVQIVGSGRGATILVGAVSGGNMNGIHSAYGAANISVRDLTIDNSAMDEADGIKIVNASRVVVENVEVIGGRQGFQVIMSSDVLISNCIAREQKRNIAGGTSNGFTCADNPTYFGDTRIQFVNCISTFSDDFGFTIVGTDSSHVVTGAHLVNCIAFRTGYRPNLSHTASVAGYAFNLRNTRARLVNCMADTPYEIGYLLATGTSFSTLVGCDAENVAVGGAASGQGYYAQSGADDLQFIGCRAIATNGRGFYIQGTNRAQLIGCSGTGSTGGNGYGINFDAALLTVVVGMVLNGNVTPSLLQNSPTFSDGHYGGNPIAKPLLATGAGATADNIITVLQNLNLVRQS